MKRIPSYGQPGGRSPLSPKAGLQNASCILGDLKYMNRTGLVPKNQCLPLD